MIADATTAVLGSVRDTAVRVVELVYENRHAAYYAVGCILVFAVTYWAMGIQKHFDVPDYLKGRENSFFTGLYTSALAQSNAMPDTTPKSTVARALFLLQVCLGWAWFLLLNPKSVF